jgi:lipid-binding SYLF domain-containing protein
MRGSPHVRVAVAAVSSREFHQSRRDIVNIRSDRLPVVAALMLGIFLACLAGPSAAASAEEKRAEIRKMRSDTLEKLYKVHPLAKGAIRDAVGYAVFSNVGINLLFISAAGGSGVAHDNRSGKDIYMSMLSGGLGLGLGLKDFRGVFVFATDKAFRQFVDSGWEADVQADAAAKAGTKGGAFAGAITVAPGVELYQLTETGLALQATIQGTKYFKDKELNAK